MIHFTNVNVKYHSLELPFDRQFAYQAQRSTETTINLEAQIKIDDYNRVNTVKEIELLVLDKLCKKYHNYSINELLIKAIPEEII